MNGKRQTPHARTQITAAMLRRNQDNGSGQREKTPEVVVIGSKRNSTAGRTPSRHEIMSRLSTFSVRSRAEILADERKKQAQSAQPDTLARVGQEKAPEAFRPSLSTPQPAPTSPSASGSPPSALQQPTLAPATPKSAHPQPIVPPFAQPPAQPGPERVQAEERSHDANKAAAATTKLATPKAEPDGPGATKASSVIPPQEPSSPQAAITPAAPAETTPAVAIEANEDMEAVAPSLRNVQQASRIGSETLSRSELKARRGLIKKAAAKARGRGGRLIGDDEGYRRFMAILNA